MADPILTRGRIFWGALGLLAAGGALGGVLFSQGGGDRDGDSDVLVRTSGGQTVAWSELAGFDRVRLVGAFDLDLVAGEDFSVELRGNRALLDRMTARVEDGTLVIEPERGAKLRGNVDLDLTIHLPTLAALTIDGAVDGGLSGLDSEELAIAVNGAAELDGTGRCGTLSLVINGAGDSDFSELACREASVVINGAGSAEIRASESASVTLNGVGGIEVHGNPAKLVQSKGGFGKITVHGPDERG